MPSYVLWALVGMVGYSFTTLFVKLATRLGLPSSVVIAIATTMVAVACWTTVGLRSQFRLTADSLLTPSGGWAIATGLALTIAVTSLFRGLEAGPASVVVPIYGMFIVGGFVLGIVVLGEPFTSIKAIGMALALTGVALICL